MSKSISMIITHIYLNCIDEITELIIKTSPMFVSKKQYFPESLDFKLLELRKESLVLKSEIIWTLFGFIIKKHTKKININQRKMVNKKSDLEYWIKNE